MPSPYPQRALTVLLLFGTLSAAMALLSSSLIFQLPSGRAAPGAGSGAFPEPVAAALVPVSAVLAALCLVLNVSCLLLCLLHGYCSTELGRGQPGGERAHWFLLDSRSVRHVALGLFCCGLCLYLTALALFMLLQFQLEAGIASASILTSGILLLLLSVLHALLRASHISQDPQNSPNSRPDPSQALYENDSAPHGCAWNKTSAAPPPPKNREFSFPTFPEGKSRPGSASSGDLSSVGSAGSKEFPEFQRQFQREWPRTHRTLAEDSGLLREQGNPWNVIPREIRDGMARKASGKDSTLV